VVYKFPDPFIIWGNKTFLLQHLVSRRKHAGFITSRAFMQENQALNQRLVEMQKSNEEIHQMMENLKSLKQQVQQNQSRQQEVKKPGFLDKALQVIPVLAGVRELLLP